MKIDNNVLWEYYNEDDITISVAHTMNNELGKWHTLEIVITNNTNQPIPFDPADIFASSYNSKGKVAVLEVFSPEQYMQKVDNKHSWSRFFMQLGEGLATANAGHSTTTSMTYHSGLNDIYNNSYPYYSTTYTNTYNPAEAYIARTISQERINEHSEQLANQRYYQQRRLLYKTTIQPQETISGFVHIKRKKFNYVYFIVQVANNKYLFEWQNHN